MKERSKGRDEYVVCAMEKRAKGNLRHMELPKAHFAPTKKQGKRFDQGKTWNFLKIE